MQRNTQTPKEEDFGLNLQNVFCLFTDSSSSHLYSNVQSLLIGFSNYLGVFVFFAIGTLCVRH